LNVPRKTPNVWSDLLVTDTLSLAASIPHATSYAIHKRIPWASWATVRSRVLNLQEIGWITQKQSQAGQIVVEELEVNAEKIWTDWLSEVWDVLADSQIEYVGHQLVKKAYEQARRTDGSELVMRALLGHAERIGQWDERARQPLAMLLARWAKAAGSVETIASKEWVEHVRQALEAGRDVTEIPEILAEYQANNPLTALGLIAEIYSHELWGDPLRQIIK